MSSQRAILHVDMDAFFAAIELRNNPHLQGKPVIVGGSPSGRGVVSTASYEARKYGIHSAMPAGEAYRLCREAIFLHGDFSAYHHASHLIEKILLRFSPAVEMVSIDEAFLDATGTEKIHGPAELTAVKIKNAVREEIGITCTVGIAPNKLLAKLGSALNKPDGLTIIKANEIEQTVYPLPVDKLWGVGPVTYERLLRNGVKTIGDLAMLNESSLKTLLGDYGRTLAARARGEDDRSVRDHDELHFEKSMSHETTLGENSHDPEHVHRLLAYLAEKVVIRLYRGDWLARTVGIRVRYPDFKTITRDKTLAHPSVDYAEILDTASSLVPTEQVVSRGARLVGVRTSNLVHVSDLAQMDLFSDEKSRHEQLNRSIHNLRTKFGDNIIKRAGGLGSHEE